MSRTDKQLIGVALACVGVLASKGVLPYSLWLTVVGVLFGGIVSALVSYYFAQKASKELREEAAALRRETAEARHYVDALISFLEAAGEIRVVQRDENDRPIKTQIIRMLAATLGVSGLSAKVTVEGEDPPAPDDED